MNFESLKQEVESYGAQLLAVSKTKPIEDIKRLYDLGQRDFGENKVQEILWKKEALPQDIRWHLIGHLQSNKVKKIVGQSYLIQSIDSLKLVEKIESQAEKKELEVNILLQVHIAQEEHKYGMNEKEVGAILEKKKEGAFSHVHIKGLMGMATLTDDQKILEKEFKHLHELFLDLQKDYPHMKILSIGMSGDYKLALECGSTMVRVGSLLFGPRNY